MSSKLLSEGSRTGINMFIPSVILSILSIFCYGLYYKYCSYNALWLGVILSFAGVLLGILESKRETEKLLSVVIFLICLRTLSMWRRQPWGFTFATDSSYGVQLSNLINETGMWIPGMGLLRTETEYSFYPAMHIWTVMLSEVTGLNVVFLAQFLFPILCGTLTIVFYYLAMRPLLTKGVAIWSSLIFCLNPMFVFFDGTYVHEAFALIFYALCLMIISRVYFERRKSRGLFAIGILAAFAVVLSHHWTSYNLLISSIVFLVLPGAYSYLVSFLHRSTSRRISTVSVKFVAITSVAVLFWVAFIAFYVFSRHTEAAAGFVVSVVNPAQHRFTVLVTYNFLENVIIVFGVLVLITLGATELIVGLLKKDKSPLDFLFESWFIFSSVYMYSLTFGSKRFFDIGKLWERSWPFAFFGVSPLIAKNIAKKHSWSKKFIPKAMYKKSFAHLKPLILIFPLISTVLQAPGHIHDPSRFLPGDSYFSAALWVRDHLSNETITVDAMSYLVLVPYGRVDFHPGSIYLFDQAMSALYEFNDPSDIPEEWRILVFNKNISTWYPDVSSNSSRLEMYFDKIHDTKSLTIFIRQ